MADTTYLRTVVESYVRRQLQDEFGRSFRAEFLSLTPGGKHEFDAVSSDRDIVVSIKAASGLTASGKNPAGKIKDCVAELYYLSLVEAPIRRLVLTTPGFFDIFTRKTRGAVALGIEVVCVPLPPSMQVEVDEVVRKASREVTPAAAEAAIAGEVERDMESTTGAPS
jgi:hypothetical protein